MMSLSRSGRWIILLYFHKKAWQKLDKCIIFINIQMDQIKRLKIDNDLGLHARAAARIVELTAQYNSKLFFQKDDQEVDGSSILSILTLDCPKGSEIQAKAVGEDSEELMERLSELFTQKFGETI